MDASVTVTATHSSGIGETTERPSCIAAWRRSYDRMADTPAVSAVAITTAASA